MEENKIYFTAINHHIHKQDKKQPQRTKNYTNSNHSNRRNNNIYLTVHHTRKYHKHVTITEQQSQRKKNLMQTT